MKKLYYTLLLFFALPIFILPYFTYGITNISEKESQKLTLAFSKLPYTLNFLHEYEHTEANIHSSIYSGLLTLNPNTLRPDVGLAISWFVNETYDEFTFNIRNNAIFSDGSPVLADDVKASWISAIQSDNAFASLFELIKGVGAVQNGEGSIDDIQIKVINAHVLKVTLKEPAPYFLSIVAHPAFSVTSRKQLKVQDWDEYPTDIIVSGPFKVQAKTEDKLILVKNKSFWDEKSVYFDEVEINFYDETNQKNIVADINGNKVQWANFYILPKDEDGKPTMKVANEDWIIQHPIFGTQYLFFSDTQNEPWNNKNVRTAIKLLLPLRKFLDDNYIFPASSLVPPMPGTYEPEIPFPKQNRELALEMLKDEGYPEGKGLGDIVLLVSEYSSGGYSEIFDMVKENLELSLETKVILKLVPSHDYADATKEGEFTMAIAGWIGDFADPVTFLQLWTNPNPVIGHNYDSEDYRKIISESNLEQGDDRIEKLMIAENMLIDDTVIIPIQRIISTNLVRTDILLGWHSNILDVHLLGAMYKEETRKIPRFTFLGTSSRH